MAGSVAGRHVVIVDDIIDTAGTVTNAAELVKDQGAISVRIAATHGVFSDPALDRLKNAPDRRGHRHQHPAGIATSARTGQGSGALDRPDPGRGPAGDLHGLFGVRHLPRRERLGIVRRAAFLALPACDRPPPSAHSDPQSRLRALVIALVAIFIIAFFFLRGSGEECRAGRHRTPTGRRHHHHGAGGHRFDRPRGRVGPPFREDRRRPQGLPALQAVRLETTYRGCQATDRDDRAAGDDRLFIVQRFGVIRSSTPTGSCKKRPSSTQRQGARRRHRARAARSRLSSRLREQRKVLRLLHRPGRAPPALGVRRSPCPIPIIASPDTEKVLIELEQPPDATDIRHYAGHLGFGPEGYLYCRWVMAPTPGTRPRTRTPCLEPYPPRCRWRRSRTGSPPRTRSWMEVAPGGLGLRSAEPVALLHRSGRGSDLHRRCRACRSRGGQRPAHRRRRIQSWLVRRGGDPMLPPARTATWRTTPRR